jgi:hypothetical protein
MLKSLTKPNAYKPFSQKRVKKDGRSKRRVLHSHRKGHPMRGMAFKLA